MTHTSKHRTEDTISPIIALMAIVFVIAAAVIYIFSEVPEGALYSGVSAGTDLSRSSASPISHGTVYMEGVSIDVELALTGEARERGLSGRDFLGDNAGMLFVFPSDDRYGFWMKDMNFPLDIIWFDQNFKVVDVAESVSPVTFPNSFLPRDAARYVLEINAGMFKNLGGRIGDLASFERSL